MGEFFEEQTPNWPPGSGSGYHAITYGWLVDQLMRRTDPDARSLGTFLREELTHKYGLEFHLGLPEEEFYKVARQEEPGFLDYLTKLNRPSTLFNLYSLLMTSNSTLLGRVLLNPDWFMGQKGLSTNNPDVLKLEIGAANGVGTARGLAGLMDLLVRKEIFQPNSKVPERISQHITDGFDLVIGAPIKWGHGFMHATSPTGSQQIGHPGYGGQNAKIDFENQLAFAYITNGLTPDMGDDARNFVRLQQALYDSIAL